MIGLMIPVFQRLSYMKRMGLHAVYALLIMAGLSSCLPEQKIARTFISSQNAINIRLNAPSVVFKYNHKGELISGFDSLSENQQDSALWADSKYIQFLNDSVILESYVNGFITELRDLGFNVYLNPSDDSMLATKPQSYRLDMAQLQLDEYLYPMEDEQEIEGIVYIKRFKLNAADFSAWYELAKAGTGASKKTVLYSSSSVYDSFEGKFITVPYSEEVRYSYSIDTLKVSDIYTMCAYLGKKHAGFLFDFFMNQYISFHMPQGLSPLYYFHYNRKRQTVLPAGDDEMFELLNN